MREGVGPTLGTMKDGGEMNGFNGQVWMNLVDIPKIIEQKCTKEGEWVC